MPLPKKAEPIPKALLAQPKHTTYSPLNPYAHLQLPHSVRQSLHMALHFNPLDSVIIQHAAGKRSRHEMQPRLHCSPQAL